MCGVGRDAAVAAAVAALRSLRIPHVSIHPETEKVSVSTGTGTVLLYTLVDAVTLKIR